MLKKEVKIIVTTIIEAGKGLALADFLQNKELKNKTKRVLMETIDDCTKQLELYCSDAQWRKEIKRKGN